MYEPGRWIRTEKSLEKDLHQETPKKKARTDLDDGFVKNKSYGMDLDLG
jgi:hypothetical protein